MRRRTLVDRLRWAAYDTINGVYSGIPLCCVTHFVRSSWQGNTVAMHDRNRRGSDHNAGYCVCDRCFSRQRFVSIRNNGGTAYWLQGRCAPPVKLKGIL